MAYRARAKRALCDATDVLIPLRRRPSLTVEMSRIARAMLAEKSNGASATERRSRHPLRLAALQRFRVLYGTLYVSFQTHNKTRRRINMKPSTCCRKMAKRCTNALVTDYDVYLELNKIYETVDNGSLAGLLTSRYRRSGVKPLQAVYGPVRAKRMLFYEAASRRRNSPFPLPLRKGDFVSLVYRSVPL